MILFETDASVFEILWDIALALFIIRTAFVYFALTFVTGCILGYSREAHFMPVYHLTRHASELIEIPLMFLAVMLWARWSMVYYEIPATNGWGGLRLAIGFVALGFMLISEALGDMLIYYTGARNWVSVPDRLSAGIFGGMLVLYALMPWLLMVVPNKVIEASHGHEDKTLSHAIPTVTKIEKEETKGEGEMKTSVKAQEKMR